MNTLKKCVIITTINEPTETIYKHIKNVSYDVIIVGDKKTPSTYKNLNCIFLDIEKQIEHFKGFAEMIPYNHYSRKNLGYLYAIQEGYDILYETDDDNIPYDDFDKILTYKPIYSIEEKNNVWINIFKYFTNDAHIWPRGYPLSLIKSESFFDIQKTEEKPSIICGLVENDPDVDSIFRLTAKQNIQWEENKYIIVSNKNSCPFNTQNTFWLNKQLFVSMLIPCTVSFRYCDILRGIIASEVLKRTGNSMMFTSPNVRQDRNEHNLMSDFKSEIEMFIQNETVLDGLGNVNFLYMIQAKGKLPEIYECLRKRDHILLSYKEQTQDTHIYYPNSTWTTGRNKIREYVLLLDKKYDYYIFLDEDVIFLEKTQEDGFNELETLVKKYLPYIATPNYVGYYEAHAQKRVERVTEATTAIEVDALLNIFSYEAFTSEDIFPYVDIFDTISWWASQWILICLMYAYKKEVMLFNFLKIGNIQSSEYPKGEYISKAIEYLDERLASSKNKTIRDYKEYCNGKFYVKEVNTINMVRHIYRKLYFKKIIGIKDIEILNKWTEYFN